MVFNLLKKLCNKWFEKKKKPIKLLNTDCFYLIIEQVPLAERLQTVQKVNSQWKTTVENLCKAQKELTLQIGRRGSQWEEIARDVTANQLLVNAANHFYTLTVAHLNGKLTSYLRDTFPRLQTLTVIVDDQTEDVSLIHHLPRLISSYTDTLITLQLILNVKNAPFQAVFPLLISNIDSLHKLQHLSLFDSSRDLEAPPFDLPNLFCTFLNSLDFVFLSSPPNIAHHWVASLQGRTKPNLMQVNFKTKGKHFEESLFSYPVEIAAHFSTFYPALFRMAVDLINFINTFSSLRSVWLGTHNLSIMGTLFQLDKLPHLTELSLASTVIDAEVESIRRIYQNTPFPKLSSVQFLCFYLHLQYPFRHAFLDDLHLSAFFPSLKNVTLHLAFLHCSDCGWKLKVPIFDGESSARLVEENLECGSEDQVEQCITKVVTPWFAKTKPNVCCTLKQKFGISEVVCYRADVKGQKVMLTKKQMSN